MRKTSKLMMLLTTVTSIRANATGPCDSEDFYPVQYYIRKAYSSSKYGVWWSDFRWSKSSQYFVMRVKTEVMPDPFLGLPPADIDWCEPTCIYGRVGP